MEYKISNRLKIGAIVLIVLGFLGVGYGFMDAYQYENVDDVKELLASESHHGDVHSDDDATELHADGDAHGAEAHAADEHKMSHEEHVLHQIHNRPYAALYVAAFFFFMIALGVLAFYAIQYASQAGWSPVLFRVMEGITAYVLPGGIIVLLIAFVADSHIFIWMDESVVANDTIIQNKESWLNKPWFFIRGLIYLAGWSLYRHFSRKF